MECPSCRHDNDIEAKFCEQCAAPLTKACTNCGSPASRTAKFCAQCGHPLQPVAADESSRFASPRDYTPQHLAEKILTSRAALEGERKQVTVLFADIKSSTELVVIEAMERLYFDRLIEQVERLAYHSVRGELKEKAAHYLRQAGAKAAARGALQEARTSFEQALNILKSLPDSSEAMEEAFEIRLALRTVLRQLGEVELMLEHLREAEVLAEKLNDDVRRCRVFSFLTLVLSN